MWKGTVKMFSAKFVSDLLTSARFELVKTMIRCINLIFFSQKSVYLAPPPPKKNKINNVLD